MKIEINVIPEKLLIKIWTSLVDRGVGALLAPWHEKRLGRSRAEDRRTQALIDAQTERDIAEIRAGRKELPTSLALPPLAAARAIEGPGAAVANEATGGTDRTRGADELTCLLAAANADGSLREAQRVLNLRRIVSYAEEEAESVKADQISEEPVDPDWFSEWERRAGNVTSEILQRLWAKILAGEHVAPGSFSLHTLDLLSRLSKSDADLIGKLGPIYMDGGYVWNDDEQLNAAGLPFEKRLELEEMGIIVGTHGLGLVQSYGPGPSGAVEMALVCNGKAVAFRGGPPFELPMLRVTTVGQELLNLGTFTAPDAYFMALAQAIKAKGHGVSIGESEAVGGGKVRIKNPLPI